MMETWKDIPGYENLYQVSDAGNVRACDRHKKHRHGNLYLQKGKVLKPYSLKKGHLVVSLHKDRVVSKFYVHRLVAQSFLCLSVHNEKMIVCHKDDDPSNNSVQNLFIGTHLDNVRDCVQKKRHYFGQRNHFAKLTRKQVVDIKKRLLKGEKRGVVARFFGVSWGAIDAIYQGRNWKQVTI